MKDDKEWSKMAIILNFIILFAGAGVVWGIQRSDVDYLKQRIEQVSIMSKEGLLDVATSSKEGLQEVRNDIKYLRQEQAVQYREISNSLLHLQKSYSSELREQREYRRDKSAFDSNF